jgi:hypothetical protein
MDATRLCAARHRGSQHCDGAEASHQRQWEANQTSYGGVAERVYGANIAASGRERRLERLYVVRAGANGGSPVHAVVQDLYHGDLSEPYGQPAGALFAQRALRFSKFQYGHPGP